MKFLWLSIFFVFSHQSDFIEDLKSSNQEPWHFYKGQFKVHVSEDEEAKRKEIFEKNLKFIKDFNSKNKDVQLEVNRFAHLEKHEMQCGNKIIRQSQGEKKIESTNNIHLRYNMDWRLVSAVSPIENQGYCGACYAFTALGSIESSFALKTGELNVLSKQQVIDCSTSFGNSGCCGGIIFNVFTYAMSEGITTQNNYQYKEKLGPCLLDPIDEANGVRLLNFRLIEFGDEIALVRALSFTGPVSIAIDANHDEFRFYRSGILKIANCSTTQLTHGVLAVGYNLGSDPYLLVKNSYGTDWGENGYFRIALFENNMCGIATVASYPIPLLEGTHTLPS